MRARGGAITTTKNNNSNKNNNKNNNYSNKNNNNNNYKINKNISKNKDNNDSVMVRGTRLMSSATAAPVLRGELLLVFYLPGCSVHSTSPLLPRVLARYPLIS